MSTTATPPNESLSDELLTINSIYTPTTLVPSSPSSSSSSQTYSLRLPSLPSITLRIHFPPAYPDAPPSILGTETVGDDLPKGAGTHVVDIVRRVLAEVYTPGLPCVFSLLEEVREALERAEEEGTLVLYSQSEEQRGSQLESSTRDDEEEVTQNDGMADASLLGPEPPWVIAPPITEKKSVFIARAARVSSPSEARDYVKHLLATDKKVARATHNITAWRIRGANGATYQDCDDDGETAAGGRVLHLMQLMDVWDVMVVVTRWYGGILLGPDRFRIINSAAREALVLGGFAKEGKEAGAGDGRKKTKK
ncbi:UPF0029-domain-containing protein [Westerdykella ornata]|uniref:UPF0029-domain-containing protein n=1 Tax=Westerdykella ornata TaxID=318751 RepID=A0A6A6JNE1_WESOR|nr:UPF0029-domain-containing protein [Westerdykella ornata]KAF2276439.1 UPF0029-domain-containing protein [Westerdykella ornata]